MDMGCSIRPAASMSDIHEGEKATTPHLESDVGSGAKQVKALSENMTNRRRSLLLLSIFLVAFSFSLGHRLGFIYEVLTPCLLLFSCPRHVQLFSHHRAMLTLDQSPTLPLALSITLSSLL